MYAYGTFFERYGDRSKIDTVVGQAEVELGFIDEGEMTDEQYKAYCDLPFNTSLVIDSLQWKYEKLNKFLKAAAKGKALVFNEEEWLVAVAGTRKEARQAFLIAYANEVEEEFD
jgi:hypothetical protein